MVKVGIFAIGSELLEGSIVDTNSAWLGQVLTKAGFDVVDVRLIPDDKEKLTALFKEGFDKYDAVLTTGGLGPTFDDMTAETLGDAAGSGTEMNEEAKAHMVGLLEARGVTIKESHVRQAMLPKDCMLFANERGTAMGFGVEINGNVTISMPGIPYEMTYMFEKHVMPYLLKRFNLKERFSIDVRLSGLPESDVDDALMKLGIPEGVECIINVSKGECFVKLRSFDKDKAEEFANKVKTELAENFVGFDEDGLAAVLLRNLREKRMTISVAESCTGGLIAKELTDVAGSSDVFKGGIIAYCNEVKERILRVPKNIMVKHGAVSEQTVRAMAVGAANTIQTRCAISISGVAGPDGGTEEKPVGTVCIGFCVDKEVVTKKYHFMGDREAVRTRAMKVAIKEMTDLVKKAY
jgi:nicotinamide-nucleotide amidase